MASPFRTDRLTSGPMAALALLVVMPIAAMSGLAWYILSEERATARMRFERLLQSRLDDVRLGLEQRTLEMGQNLARTLVGVRRDTKALRELRSRLPLARELFILDRNGKLIFPPASDASSEELAFRQRTEALWEGAVTLYEPPVEERSLSTRRRGSDVYASISGQAQGDSLMALSRRRGEGWLSWYWQDGLHLLFWRRAGDGAVVGAEVDRIVLLSRLLASTPEWADVPGRLVLFDAKDDVLHGWGPYRPPSGQRPDMSRNLAYPLDAWRLRFFADPAAGAYVYGVSVVLAMALGVGAVALTLVGLAIWIWRSSTRAMREARERVSFVTQVSHELKTPLANIRLYAELLEEDLELLEDDGATRRLDVIVSESQRLSRLIGNILTFTKQQRGAAGREADAVLADEVVRRAVEQFTPALAAKAIETQVELAAPTAALANADGLEQVLSNLINNVEKYAASGAWLRVATEQKGDRTQILVEDRGPGIPKRQAARIFEPFYRLSDRLDDGVTGTGIGLAIAKTLVEGWGGRLRHERPDGGLGARFVVELRTAEEGIDP